MYWPKIETPRLKSNNKLAGPTIIITGFLVSLWANCVFVASISDRNLDGTILFIVFTAFITHVIISIATSVALMNGFHYSKPDLFKPWMYVKAIEMVALLNGMLIQCASYYHYMIGIVPVGIIVLVIASYLFLCIFSAWKQMKDNPTPPKPTNNLDLETVNLEMPPSYDSFANQTNVK